MDRRFVVDNAKCIVFPKVDNSCSGKYDEYLSHHDHIKMKASYNDRYVGMIKNGHHYTTRYHRETVLPTICRLFDTKFDPNNYYLKNNIVKEGSKSFDLSYYVPKHSCRFCIEGFEWRIKYECGFDGLLYNPEVKNTTWFTPYHALYAFPHSVSRITNLGKSNGKSIIVSGDSQMIPSIAILASLYKDVYYFDNRCDLSFAHIYRSLNNVDDVLMSLYCDDLYRYTNTNLK